MPLVSSVRREARVAEPLVVSASRATDIPAFHGDWFMGRLRAGFCRRRNPCNSKQESVISFARTRVFVFWTKHPLAFLPFLPEIEASGRQFYFQYTLNDYVRERLEPRLPSLNRRLDTFRRLADSVGPQRVVWRFDPLVLGNDLGVERLLDRVDRLGRLLSPYTEKLVFSFLDMYRKTRCALRRHDPSLRAPTEAEMRELAGGIVRLNATWPHALTIAACAEELDLRALGVARNKCIDDALILRLCPRDEDVRRALSPGPRQGALLASATAESGRESIRDKGQRTSCGCIPSRDIGAYGTCPHFCVYCYANRSERFVRAAMERCRVNPEERESLLP
ncbi:MAG: DUF1848 domain-containing protein [Desulfovibrio sp.]|uniref:DUF1848 domain-containing protein n=1 Tax=Desulfovibrio sp. TaxID=885 RepID=UPI0025B7BE6D|nr:DUF1848 domain-containing protein [Desulfovibrio sp.]MCI7568731.1 DUF1848 domain-containing protein [Desulfovibrio sp.]